jgi:hypothetical protein
MGLSPMSVVAPQKTIERTSVPDMELASPASGVGIGIVPRSIETLDESNKSKLIGSVPPALP